MITLEQLNKRGIGFLPGYLGVVITKIAPGELCAELAITPQLMAPNGYLHAGTILTIADTASGYGCVAKLPEGATGFTTIELKTNFLGTARSGVIACVAKAAHLGRTRQVWDATVTHHDTGKTIAMFRCTQMVLYAKQDHRSPQPV